MKTSSLSWPPPQEDVHLCTYRYSQLICKISSSRMATGNVWPRINRPYFKWDINSWNTFMTINSWMMGFYQQNCEELSWLSWLDAATLKTAMRFPEMFLKFGIPFHSSLCVGKKKKLNTQMSTVVSWKRELLETSILF